MPTVSAPTIVRCRGSSGYSAGVIPIATIRNAAKTDFVTKSFVTRWMLRRIRRPSATIAGNGGEVAVDEHDVGDRLRHLRARALRDREARRLQRRHVVDAVADHRHVAAAPPERLDDAPLALRRDPPDDARATATSRSSSSVVAREIAARRAAARARGCRRRRDRGDRARQRRRRARRSRRPARRGRRSSRASPGRSSSASTASPSGAQRRRAGVGVVREARVASSRSRRPAGRPSWWSRGDARRGHRAGRAPARRARSGRRRAAGRSSGAARGTGSTRRPAPGSPGTPRRSPPASRSAPRTRPRTARAPRRAPRSVDTGRGHERHEPQRRLGQRAGLVDADRVDRRERLDRVQLLRERAGAGHPHRRRRVGDRDEQDQALGDERHHPRDRGLDRVADRDVLLPRAPRSASPRAAPSPRAARRGAGRSPARAASAGGGTRAPSPRSARRSCRRRPRRPRTTRALDDERARPDLLPDASARPRAPRRSGSTRRGAGRCWRRAARRRRPGRPGASRTRSPTTTSETCSDRGSPSRTTVACGATSAASSSSFRLRPELLPDPDPGVRDDDPEEERVAPVAEDERQEAEREQDRVERRDRVGTDDRRGRAARRGLPRLAPRCEARRGLRLGQA